jgi:hypothetical protein
MHSQLFSDSRDGCTVLSGPHPPLDASPQSDQSTPCYWCQTLPSIDSIVCWSDDPSSGARVTLLRLRVSCRSSLDYKLSPACRCVANGKGEAGKQLFRCNAECMVVNDRARSRSRKCWKKELAAVLAALGRFQTREQIKASNQMNEDPISYQNSLGSSSEDRKHGSLRVP